MHPYIQLRIAERDGIDLPLDTTTIRLGAKEKDRSLFAQMLVLLREAEDLQPDEAAREAFRASMQTITDAASNTHTMSVTNLRALLVAYGTAYQALWTAAQAG